MDIGCGEGHFTKQYMGHCGRVTGLDVSRIAIGRARRLYSIQDFALQFEVHDITKEKYGGSAWETVLLSEVLYYIKPELWSVVSKNIKDMVHNGYGQFIISVGQYFTESDIKKIFPWCEFDQVYKLPSKKYEYNLIMSGRKK